MVKRIIPGAGKILVFLFLSFFLSVSISGCGGVFKHKKIEANAPGLKDRINKSLANLYPDKFKAVQHVILKLFGKTYVLNGYLKIDRPAGEIALIAQNDPGGTIFDLSYVEGKKKEINVKLKTLKKEWLEKSALEDLKNLYFNAPLSAPGLFKDDSGDLILSKTENDKTREYVFNAADKTGNRPRLKEIRYFSKKKLARVIMFQDYLTLKEYSCPKFILIKNYRMRYSLEISVQYII